MRQRKTLLEDGRDAGPASIRGELAGLAGLPSESTIWRILTNRGLVTPEPKKAPKHGGRRFNAERANETWPLDDTDWELADGTTVKVLNILDDCSRMAMACRAITECTGAAALDTFSSAAAEYGWPERFLSDCAPAFRYMLAEALAPVGVAPCTPAPTTLAATARSNGSIKPRNAGCVPDPKPPRSLSSRPGSTSSVISTTTNGHIAPSIDASRPTSGQRPPSGPANHPISRATTTHHDIVNAGNVCAGNRFKITVGRRYEGQPALIVTTDTNCHVFINGRLARRLTLDTTQRLQPLNPKPTTTEREDPRHA